MLLAIMYFYIQPLTVRIPVSPDHRLRYVTHNVPSAWSFSAVLTYHTIKGMNCQGTFAHCLESHHPSQSGKV
jgi:hypothetical protein